MLYQQEQVLQAFKIYSLLAQQGYVEKDEVRWYLADDALRGLVDQFAAEMECTLFLAGEMIYLIPLAITSPFHVSNETLKKDYLPSRAVNLDIYMMYLSIIILFGEFYDSYQTREATRDFLPLSEWLNQINERIQSLKEHHWEDLKEWEEKYEYNWTALIDNWEAIDDIKENVQQTARTNSRMSFLNVVKRFLAAQGLINDIGNDQLELTEKAKLIIQRYYMEADYNRGILEFIYHAEKRKDVNSDASHRQDPID